MKSKTMRPPTMSNHIDLHSSMRCKTLKSNDMLEIQCKHMITRYNIQYLHDIVSRTQRGTHTAVNHPQTGATVLHILVFFSYSSRHPLVLPRVFLWYASRIPLVPLSSRLPLVCGSYYARMLLVFCSYSARNLLIVFSSSSRILLVFVFLRLLRIRRLLRVCLLPVVCLLPFFLCCLFFLGVLDCGRRTVDVRGIHGQRMANVRCGVWDYRFKQRTAKKKTGNGKTKR